MLTRIWNYFTPPVFSEDDDKTRRAKYAHAITLAFLGAVAAFEIFVRISEGYTGLSIMDLIMVGLAILLLAGLALLKRGYVRIISFLLVGFVWIASNSIAAAGFGVKDASYITNFAIILMAGLLLGWRVSVGITLLSALSGLALAYAEQTDLITIASYPVLSFARDVTIVFVLNGVLILLLITGLENALKNSREHLKELEVANTSLNVAQLELEARTADLLVANDRLENRTRKLHAVAEVTRVATALQNFDDLVTSITRIISNQLGYYHVAVFLLDEHRQFALLRSASTEAGKKMLSRGYRLPVGQLGVVSSVAQTGQPRIALDLRQEKAFIQDPELPEIQSQMALPLKSGDEVIGVLDIQSARADDFTETDISILSILADQVGIAIQNALLFESSQRALREANIESLQTSKRAWQEYAEAVEMRGYRYDGIKSEPLQDLAQLSTEEDALLIPVQVRGQTIGRLKLQLSDHSHQWTDDELVLVNATAERVALALESARLLETAQKRAARETFLSEVAAKLSTSFQLDSILRDTVQEVGQALRDSTVTFQLVEPSESEAATARKTNGSSEQGVNHD